MSNQQQTLRVGAEFAMQFITQAVRQGLTFEAVHDPLEGVVIITFTGGY